jgi:5'-3' exonuclease
MGIPSYFSYIVKNYPHILSKFVSKQRPIDNLYLDCNSIIYDVYHRLSAAEKDKNNKKTDVATAPISDQIIRGTIQKIREYIALVAPRKTVYIAFDGVAPAAKIEQQRSRRYKSWYQAEVSKYIYNEPPPQNNNKKETWTTLAITPGTNFMGQLDREINAAFPSNQTNKTDKNSQKQTTIVSGSNDVGEGEHKLFEYIRQHPEKHKNETTAIYGLDADLIVLSICHLAYAPNLFLLRESPHFHMENLEPNANYLLDIRHLNEAMDMHTHDYIVLTFLLGNDFLPHFPALNIRTGGMDKLRIAYHALFPPKKEKINQSYLTTTTNQDSKTTIHWGNMRIFIATLADKEDEYVKEEHKLRDRREYVYPIRSPEEKFKKFESTPTFERDIEKHINPFKQGWQDRYYTSLFPNTVGDRASFCTQNQNTLQEKVALNFCEGLEWTLRYYTGGCPDWRWTYRYLYPPLLKDLNQYLLVNPKPHIELHETHKPVSQIVQLCSVLPKAGLIYLPPTLQEKLLADYSHWYPTDCCFLWAYCRYFWETHVVMQHIDMEVLEKLIQSAKKS